MSRDASPPPGPAYAVAVRAFEHFTHALATGEWDGFFAMLSDDVEVWFPTGRFKGRRVGRASAIELFRFVRTAYPDGLFVELDRVLSGGDTVAFEFRDHGRLFGRPYANRVVVALDVRDGLIAGYREYFGSDGVPPEGA